MMICREGGVCWFPAMVVVLVELRVRRAWGLGGGEGERLLETLRANQS